MLTLLARWLIPNWDDIGNPAVRRAYGILCGWMGVVFNLLLFTGKLAIGLLSGSIAVTADAFNNLSDAGSSVVTLLGFKLAAHAPDRAHPFGHGRMEYISGFIVSMIVILMGVELGKSSLEEIFQPSPVSFTPLAALVLVASIAVKLYMALYNRAVGRRIDSAAVTAAFYDSLSDCLATTAVLLGSFAGHFWQIPLDGWCGAAVAVFILWSGIQSAKATIDLLLGQPPSPNFVKKVRDLVLSHKEIVGIHDLIVHDYGPGRRILSLHAEVPADGNLVELHEVIDTTEQELSNTMGCLATIHMDPVVTNGGPTSAARERVETIVKMMDPEITIHDFRMIPGPTCMKIIFDVQLPYQCPLEDEEVARRIRSGVQALDGTYAAVVRIDRGYL